jgi:antirestriction protein
MKDLIFNGENFNIEIYRKNSSQYEVIKGGELLGIFPNERTAGIAAFKACNFEGEYYIHTSTYARYAAGSLDGDAIGIDNTINEETFYELVHMRFLDEYLRNSLEPMYQDTDLPEAIVSESHIDFEKLADFLELDENERDICTEYWEECDSKTGVAQILDYYFYTFSGEHDHNEEFGEYLALECDCINIPDNIQPYFDFARYGRDALYDFRTTTNYVFTY